MAQGGHARGAGDRIEQRAVAARLQLRAVDDFDAGRGLTHAQIQPAADFDSALQWALPASVNIDGVQLWRGLGPARRGKTTQCQQGGNGRENTAKRKQSKQ
ncbi:hypothetical protein D3C71_1784630 [compost metagenome]